MSPVSLVYVLRKRVKKSIFANNLVYKLIKTFQVCSVTCVCKIKYFHQNVVEWALKYNFQDKCCESDERGELVMFFYALQRQICVANHNCNCISLEMLVQYSKY